MLRITQILRQLDATHPQTPGMTGTIRTTTHPPKKIPEIHPSGTAEKIHAASPPGPVIVWNLTRRCNLNCLHCYSSSSDRDFSGELTTQEAMDLLTDLQQCRVPALILSGGEPLLRHDLFDLVRMAKSLGFYLGLSTNGTLLSPAVAERLAQAGFNYVGISLDGLREQNDHMRGDAGAFDRALAGLRACREQGVKAGLRFTLTEANAADFSALLDLATREGVERIYLSHLNHAGRGQANLQMAPTPATTRTIMTHIFQTALADLQQGSLREFVSGNNDADGPFLLDWIRAHLPAKEAAAQTILQRWGGNASGVGIANIDNRGNVHPDIFWWNHSLGNVRTTPFSRIWSDANPDPLLRGLRQKPRPLEGRCGQCHYLTICGGNTRVRAFQATGNPWAADPGCYLADNEIGVQEKK
ncbi:MAG: heme d1 biosynthesis radical SAM protein NirJ [Magnetococcus sp. DMHC-1]|nr:heme d1 biosynthesis radical SAM protein NirJ [Magnetococcales bacterium]